MSGSAIQFVDFCIPTYNRKEHISILLGSLPSTAVVYVQDNGGFLRDAQFPFKGNLTVESDDNIVGMFENWSRAAALGKNDWFFLTSDDDLYYDTLTEELEKALLLQPDVGMIVFGHHEIDAQGQVLRTWLPQESGVKSGREAFESFLYGVNARMPSILINRKRFQQCGGLFTDFKISAADSELVQRLAVAYPVLFVPAVVSGYRVWAGGATHEKIASEEWRLDIVLWMQRLEKGLLAQGWAKSAIWRRHIQDDIRYQNTIAGLSKLSGPRSGLRFLFAGRFPFFARPRTHLSGVLALLKCFFRARS